MITKFSKEILLASQSPRRRELLSGLGFAFEVVSISCEEKYPSSLKIEEIAGYLAELKADAFQNLLQNQVLITADTIVAINGKVLGKPADQQEAIDMLLTLSGKMHQVYTGITVKGAEKQRTATDCAEVYFDEISKDEAHYYVKNFQPFDKAGSYGVQDWLGMAKIRKIRGSFYTVMGLPTHLIYQMLSEFNQN